MFLGSSNNLKVRIRKVAALPVLAQSVVGQLSAFGELRLWHPLAVGRVVTPLFDQVRTD